MTPESNHDMAEASFTSYAALHKEALSEAEIEGVEIKHLLPNNEQSRMLAEIGAWFDGIKDKLPERGINIDVARVNPDGSLIDSLKNLPGQFELPAGVELPIEVIELFDAIMHDSAEDPKLKDMNIHLALRRTGDNHTHPDNLLLHIDTDKYLISDDDGTFTRSPGRSVGKYMAFIGRPGTIVVHGKVDPSYTQQEGTAFGQAEERLGSQIKSQLLPDNVYKVATGDVLHAAPSHDDGLLFEVSFNEPDK